jgi:hypothetical protein
MKRTGEAKSYFKILTDKPIGAEERTILKWVLKQQVSIRGIGLIRLRIGIIVNAELNLPVP